MSKLILVANRLPVTVAKSDDGYSIAPSVGGLATGMAALTRLYTCKWVGYSGVASDRMSDTESDKLTETLIGKFDSVPVPLSSHDVKLYYNGFSNRTIWPLFHYFPVYTSYATQTWEAYCRVNSAFFEKVAELYEPGDVIWIQDYQLMLLPGILRERFPDAKIGFFLHIPFPSFEVFRLLPWRREIVEGILGSDLIGFHTYSYARHFLSSVQRLLGHESHLSRLMIDNRPVRADIFPLGIDYDRYAEYQDNPEISGEIEALKASLNGNRLVLSIDRMDFTKGLVERLESFELFLEKYPEYHEKVLLVLLAVPSRTNVDIYMSLRDKVNQLVGRINGRFNRVHWSPIRYLYRSLPFETIIALYSQADVALVTPIRDGMNLVAKEYIAARRDGAGVLVLSEMAGAAEELGEALIVNPNNREEVADAIARALAMPQVERIERMGIMQRRLKRNDVVRWAQTFMDKLENQGSETAEMEARLLDGLNRKKMLQAFIRASRRLILLDYDGTLTGFRNRPEDAKADKELCELLRRLVSEPSNDTVIISGRNREFLDECFAEIPLTLVAEHGAWIRRGGEWKTTASISNEWKQELLPVLQHYTDRTPGSFVEEKEFSLVWHYRRADQDLAAIRASELRSTLLGMVANLNLGIMDGNKVLEVKNLEIGKGRVVSSLMAGAEHDFIIAIGDDVTDEDMFKAIGENGYTVKVGFRATAASYFLENVRDVRNLLGQFCGGE